MSNSKSSTGHGHIVQLSNFHNSVLSDIGDDETRPDPLQPGTLLRYDSFVKLYGVAQANEIWANQTSLLRKKYDQMFEEFCSKFW